MDVGSQGTCAQALEPDGTLVATSYEPHALRYPQAGWAEQDPGEWTAALVATLSTIRAATGGREIVALSFGSQLDGLVAAGGDGAPLHPALIWCDRRAGAECEAAAERIDPHALRALTGCNLDPGHVAAKIAWLARHERATHDAAEAFLLPGSWVAWRASGTLAVDPSNASSTGLLDPRTREWAPEACATFEVDPGRLAPVLRSDAVLGPILGWLQEATGLDAGTLVVLGAGDEMAATLGAGVVEPGVVCDVMGTAEPVCAVVSEPAHDPTGLVELHPHADPETWLLESHPGFSSSQVSGSACGWSSTSPVGSCAGWETTAHTGSAVPITSQTTPGSTTPAPSVAAISSPAPSTTSVPASRPVASCSHPRIGPRTASGRRTGARRPGSMSNAAQASGAQSRARGSSRPVEDAFEGSTARVPDARQATHEPGSRNAAAARWAAAS